MMSPCHCEEAVRPTKQVPAVIASPEGAKQSQGAEIATASSAGLAMTSGSMLRYARNDDSGFTYIEMLVVVALMAMCFVPLIQMFAKSMEEVDAYSNFGTAIELGREAMEATKNLRISEAQLEKRGVEWVPPKDISPLSINRGRWRVRKTAVRGTDPLEIRVDVFREENLEKPVVQLATLIEDL